MTSWTRSIELLEARIAPAMVFTGVFTYTDVDGDKVTVKTTHGTNGELAAAIAPHLVAAGTLGGSQLQQIDLTSNSVFAGASLVVTATKSDANHDGVPDGNGRANIGYINATGLDLDQVKVKGDLGKIVVGDSVTTDDPGLNLLSVRSMGVYGLVTGAPDLNSAITGKLGVLHVAGNIAEAWVQVTASPISDAQLGSVFVGGSLIGGSTYASGSIVADGAMGNVFVGHHLIGGSGFATGVVSGRGVNSVFVGGSVIGSSGASSGMIISAEDLGKVVVLGSVKGGTGSGSADIYSLGQMGDVFIGHNLIGGSADASGRIGSFTSIGNVVIGGDMIGGSMTGSAYLAYSGEVMATNNIASVTIGGSLIAGVDGTTGSLTQCGAIVAGNALGPVSIGGNIVGSVENPVLIAASGQTVKPSTGVDLAIAGLKVGGDVRYANILAGFDFIQYPSVQIGTNADASIGVVKIRGDWKASTIVAGAEDGGDAGFGVGDTLQTANDTALVAHIAKIVIGGEVTGSADAGDNFGFVAQQLDSVWIGGKPVSLTSGPGNENILVPFTDDVHLLEVV